MRSHRLLAPVSFIATVVSAVTLALGSGLTGCWDIAENDQHSLLGNSRFGNSLSSDLSIDRDGRFLVAATEHDVFALDLIAFSIVRLDAPPTARFIFGASGEAFFADPIVEPERRYTRLARVSLTEGRRTHRWTVDHYSNAMTRDPSTGRLALWSFYGADSETMSIVDPGTDTVTALHTTDLLHDVSWLADGTLVLVERHTWKPRGPLETGPDTLPIEDPMTPITFITRTGEQSTITIPNCSSRLNVSPDGTLGMVSPTFCQKDPVSLIDLRTRRFVDNLPGFGPVAFSPDGEWALAFGRQADLATFGITSETKYSLLFISTRDHHVEVMDLGDDLPTYTITPDGEVVLIYSIFETSSWDGILLVDVNTRSIRATEGPELDLNEFVMTSDGALVYLIDGGLYRLDVASGTISYVQLACGEPGQPTRCNPELVNLLPDQRTLALGWRRDPELAFFDIPEHRITRTVVLPRRTSETEPPTL
jgi:hypothetical protein